MRLFSYVVARDFGFAPNPFYGVCTLATCKPLVRKQAAVGDLILGTGSRSYGLEGRVVYFMKVAETLQFDDYWRDLRFQSKKPNFHGSVKQAFGDNIYHRDDSGRWIQANSHHSLSNGLPNPGNIRHDTKVNRVLIGFEFAYWGGSGPRIPSRFAKSPIKICKSGPGHKSNFPDDVLGQFVEWINSLSVAGYLGAPKEYSTLAD